MRPSHRFRGTSLPVAGARQRGRVAALDADAREVLRGGGGIIEEPQRDPAGMPFGVDALGRVLGAMAGGDRIGALGVALVEQLAGEQAPLDPPFIDIDQAPRVAWGIEHQLCRLGVILVAPVLLDPAENEAGIAVQFARHRVEHRFQIGRLAVGRQSRLRQRHVAGAEPLRRAHRDLAVIGVQRVVHPRLVIAAVQQCAELVEDCRLGVAGEGIAAPGLANQPLGIAAVAA